MDGFSRSDFLFAFWAIVHLLVFPNPLHFIPHRSLGGKYIAKYIRDHRTVFEFGGPNKVSNGEFLELNIQKIKKILIWPGPLLLVRWPCKEVYPILMAPHSKGHEFYCFGSIVVVVHASNILHSAHC